MTESKFAQKIIGWLPATAHHLRIETSTESGVPDLNVCYGNNEWWLELKLFVGDRVLLRPHQVAWLNRRWMAGGNVAVLAHHPCGEIHGWMGMAIVRESQGKYVSLMGDRTIITDRQSFINFMFTT